MRFLKLALSSLVLLAALALTTITLRAENIAPGVKLQFSAAAEKQDYVVGDVVKIVFTLRNAGANDVLVGRHFVLEQYVWVTILGADRKEINWCGKIDGRAERSDEFVVLRPGAKIRSAVQVSCDGHRDSGFILNRAGRYNVFAYYRMPYPVKSLQQIARNAAVTVDRISAEPISIVLRSAARAGGKGTDTSIPLTPFTHH